MLFIWLYGFFCVNLQIVTQILIMKLFATLLLTISIALFILPSIMYVVVKVLGLLFHWRITYRPFLLTGLGLVALWLALATYGHYWGRFSYETKTLTLSQPTLPKTFDGYRIVHISDMHLDGWAGHEDDLRKIVEEVNAQNPDLVCFTGDLISITSDELRPFIPVLKGLRAKDGVVSILGNHDYMPYTKWSGMTDEQRWQKVEELKRMEREELGWQLLMNENLIIRHGNDSIAVLGSENQSLGAHNIIVRGDLKKTMQGTDGMYRILLTHDPTHWRGEVLGKTDIPLTLSGHTHGGQVNILGLFYVSTFIYKEHAGLYTENGQNLYVNIGLGGTAPLRIGATPEVTVVELKTDK